MKETGKNIAASVRQRLADLGRQRGVDFQQVLSSYAIERFLYRLSVSEHARDFVLKGATLFTLWEGFPHRQTRDVDLLRQGDRSVETLVGVFKAILTASTVEDGLTFSPEIITEPIRALQEYGGTRVTLLALLGNVRITVGVDIAIGDKITPPPKLVEFPCLLDFPKPRIRAYPVETVVAEKLHALVVLGMANSRMKDFFDLWHIGQRTDFDGDALVKAVRATFERRKTAIPEQVPVGLSAEFADNPMKQTQWRAFCRKSLQTASEVDLAEVVDFLKGFLIPVLDAVRLQTAFQTRWSAGGPWE